MTRHLDVEKGFRKDGFVATVSLRALNIRAPIAAESAHGGTNPHRAACIARIGSPGSKVSSVPPGRSGRSTMIRTGVVGGIFQFGSTSSADWESVTTSNS